MLGPAGQALVPTTPPSDMTCSHLGVGLGANRQALLHVKDASRDLRLAVAMKVADAQRTSAGWEHLQGAYSTPVARLWPENVASEPALQFREAKSRLNVLLAKASPSRVGNGLCYCLMLDV